MKERLKAWIASDQYFFCKEELQFYQKKLSLAFMLIFNSDGNLMLLTLGSHIHPFKTQLHDIQAIMYVKAVPYLTYLPT